MYQKQNGVGDKHDYEVKKALIWKREKEREREKIMGLFALNGGNQEVMWQRGTEKLNGIEKEGQELLINLSHNTRMRGKLVKLKAVKFKAEERSWLFHILQHHVELDVTENKYLGGCKTIRYPGVRKGTLY